MVGGRINPENVCADLDTDGLTVPINPLSAIFRIQEKLQEHYGKLPSQLSPEKELPQFIKDMVLAATDELHELLNRTPWKPWRSYKFPEDYHPSDEELREIKMELVDVFHFFINLCLAFNMSADELFKFYIAKNKENLDRIKRGYAKGSIT